MDDGDESRRCPNRYLMDRFQNLEASHRKLQEQLQFLLQEKTRNFVGAGEEAPREKEGVASDSQHLTSFPGYGFSPGGSFFGSPYRSVLEYMGHAVHVSRAGSGEIIYWNCAAEKLYGYKCYEVVGKSVVELLFDSEHRSPVRAIMESLSSTGKSWSGQLPLKKRSGENFIAMISKSPLYEDGKLIGIITVSSDAAVFNNTNTGNMRTHQNHSNEQSKSHRINLKKIQWNAQPQASRVLQRKRWDASCDTRESEEAEVESQDVKADRPPRVPIAKPAFGLSMGRNRSERMSSKEESTSAFTQPPKIASKVFSKLQKAPNNNSEKVNIDNIQQNGSSGGALLDAFQDQDDLKVHGLEDQLPRSSFQLDGRESVFDKPNIKLMDSDDASQKNPSSGESFGSGPRSSSSKGSSDSHVVVGPDFRWEDLQLREKIGQGSFGVVYRGIWNGSDVAVKVYCGSQYNDETLLDYKKEIDIMKKLRHPNVLLFMGAVCTEEKLAIVTEYLNRGSLFKTLHRGNQSLDIKRRLRMAIDVARGMNYLHHRNPPIVHRDLKSSNLLVDKSWTVKVGDFGLSKLKCATFLTAKSGRGTPQWMAPEVLRNEPSTEKSDVFSFGVILWELVTERVPWSDLNSLQVVGFVGFMDRRLDLPENIDPQVSSIISDCWQSNPEDRPSFEDIIHRMTELIQAGAGLTTKTASTP